MDLNGPKCETPFLAQMLLDELRATYQGTCMDKAFVLRVTRIVNIAPRVWMPRKMYGEMTTAVVFEYEAELLVPSGEVSCGLTILHGGRIIEITEAGDMALATCVVNDHTTATVAIELQGVVTLDMIVPIRVLKIEYPQNIMNNINVSGELLRPAYYGDRNLFVDVPAAGELDEARMALAAFDELVAAISELERSQYFKAWLYPYKQLPAKKPQNLPTMIARKSVKAMYVRIDDTCDPTSLEFIVINRIRPIDRVTFMGFVNLLLDDAKKVWDDIAQFSRVYGPQDVFDAHKTVWSYYESAKLAQKSAAHKSAGGTLNQPNQSIEAGLVPAQEEPAPLHNDQEVRNPREAGVLTEEPAPLHNDQEVRNPGVPIVEPSELMAAVESIVPIAP